MRLCGLRLRQGRRCENNTGEQAGLEGQPGRPAPCECRKTKQVGSMLVSEKHHRKRAVSARVQIRRIRRKPSEGATWPSNPLLQSFFLLLRLADLSENKIAHKNFRSHEYRPGTSAAWQADSSQSSKLLFALGRLGLHANFGSSAAAPSPNFPSLDAMFKLRYLTIVPIPCSAEAR